MSVGDSVLTTLWQGNLKGPGCPGTTDVVLLAGGEVSAFNKCPPGARTENATPRAALTGLKVMTVPLVSKGHSLERGLSPWLGWWLWIADDLDFSFIGQSCQRWLSLLLLCFRLEHFYSHQTYARYLWNNLKSKLIAIRCSFSSFSFRYPSFTFYLTLTQSPNLNCSLQRGFHKSFHKYWTCFHQHGFDWGEASR